MCPDSIKHLFTGLMRVILQWYSSRRRPAQNKTITAVTFFVESYFLVGKAFILKKKKEL